MHPEKKALVKDGRVVARTLREELMTKEELMTQLRLQGVDDVDKVRAAYLEGNGQVSVLKRDGEADDTSRSPDRPGPG